MSHTECGFISAAFTQVPCQAYTNRSLCSKKNSPHNVSKRSAAKVFMAKTIRGESGWTANTTFEIPKTLFECKPLMNSDYQPVDFSKFKGKLVLIVNTASEDPSAIRHFAILNQLYNKYHSKGLEIIAFPSNWYGQRETRPAAEVKEVMKNEFNVKYTVMWKQIDLVTSQPFLLGMKTFPGEILWNFHTKFLFDRNGVPVGRFDLKDTTEEIIPIIDGFI
mmetsp:Transcript_13565/g.23100  ORF Transcript_13565/g.23100 Transcript_13565/m.23100 type:complete len:220 (-) Transcript_13565:191-850(-)|eukprot:CAMPEP_0184704590 /NCGR_PEP_ID=MMETSP0313-20130426/31726_1 /TAXON_ID=2792 /ORGANISM="Porphyridium aerugineum, Strain SAG 1380-2" /LENGTH=219 /DNA_ID=CAMNT_0027165689 /DNA_START=41 /DNA_END=700 /DNA_ORIENTATION=+